MLVRTGTLIGCQHLQLSAIKAEPLREAKTHPGRHRTGLLPGGERSENNRDEPSLLVYAAGHRWGLEVSIPLCH